jgi:ubiquinone biosynthesis protein
LVWLYLVVSLFQKDREAFVLPRLIHYTRFRRLPRKYNLHRGLLGLARGFLPPILPEMRIGDVFRPWLPYRALRVALAVGPPLARYLFLSLGERSRLAEPNEARWNRAHRLAADQLHRLAVDLKGLFVKAAQVAGARSDVFPEPFIEKLKDFHDAVPFRPLGDLRAILEGQLGPIDQVFTSFTNEPLAAASLAQVHTATLSTGESVAVKIQYPEIARVVRSDLASIRCAARIASILRSPVDIVSFVEEFAKFIDLELDFEREALSAIRIGNSFGGADYVRIPAVYPEYSGPRVLVLEHLEGIRITDVARLQTAGFDVETIARRVARIYFEMIFEHGFFHADPHPGNLLVLPDGRIGLVDFGLAKELPDGFNVQVATLIVRTLRGDAAGALDTAKALGFGVEGLNPEVVPRLVTGLMGKLFDDANFFDLLRENPVILVPSHMPLIFRAMILLNGLSHTLAPGRYIIQQELIKLLLRHLEHAE